MKTIVTGTEITFTKTGEKYSLTQTNSGFDVKPLRLGKNIPSEPYSFQELIDLFEAGDITFHGFEQGDEALVKSQLMNHIYNSNLKSTKQEYDVILKRVEELTAINNQLQESIQDLKNKNQELQNSNESLNKALAAMGEEV